MTGLHDYAGVIHVHSAYSDSYGRMPYILQCARDAGLDYVLVTDHNTLESRREGWEGWHDGVLLGIGVEVTSKKGHSLVFGLNECPAWTHAHPDEYLPEVAQLGGTAFIAHPERSNRGKLYRRRQAWPDLTSDHYAGIEIWSYVHDWFDRAFPWHPITAIRDPDALIAGPHPEVLRAWDHVALRRHTAGIGALDSHELHLPFRHFRWSLLTVLPARRLFRTVRTHVLTSQWSGDGPADLAALMNALVHGRCFTAYDFIADARGTQFLALRNGHEPALMGDQLQASGELEFVATTPVEADITLVRNSQPVASTHGRELVHRDARTGVYRIEARLNGRPWVYTNHIYVR